MTESKQQQEQEQAKGLFHDEVTELNTLRQSLARKIQSTAVGGRLPSSVAQAAGIMFQHFDTGYLWLTQLEQFIYMNSSENIEAVAGDKLAKGDFKVLDGAGK